MPLLRSFLALRLIMSVVLLIPTAVIAQERVLSFDSVITLAEDGSMTVAETIRVRAEGTNIRRGIFKDFPTRYLDRFGNRVVVKFEVLGVERDGQSEPWFTERLSNGVRLYAGDENTFLQPGNYSYTFRYRTDRQLGFFQDFDELYWNVTGNGWEFAIESASARVMLPAQVSASDISMEGYTGPFGSTGQDYTVSVFDGGASIRTTRPLARQEGLTLAVTWPKGIIEEPGTLQRFAYLLDDNLGLLLGLLTLVSIVIYLFTMWSRYGRDPKAGVVFPHYEPPHKYSPASARYISRMGYDTRTLTAAIINLAVKGHLKIHKADNDYVLEKLESQTPLAAGEKQLLGTLFANSTRIELDNKNHDRISKARSAHAKALRRDYLDIYFKKNTGLLLPCGILLILMLVLVGVFDYLSLVVLVLTGLSILFMAIFAWLLRAPTPRGRLLLDKLEGFKLYLEVAEKDDLDLQHPPELTPQLFEKYLPFAIALGVEQPWAESFTAVFAKLAAEQVRPYQPAWYHGHFNSFDPAGFTGGLGKGFTSAISSASSPPGSSSGAGGGGFSGGGGGGGGGGGW